MSDSTLASSLQSPLDLISPQSATPTRFSITPWDAADASGTKTPTKQYDSATALDTQKFNLLPTPQQFSDSLVASPKLVKPLAVSPLRQNKKTTSKRTFSMSEKSLSHIIKNHHDAANKKGLEKDEPYVTRNKDEKNLFPYNWDRNTVKQAILTSIDNGSLMPSKKNENRLVSQGHAKNMLIRSIIDPDDAVVTAYPI